jgi:PEP-CTERM motif
MNHKKVLLGLILAELGMGGAAQAAIYTNTMEAGTPFGVTLDSGSTPWEMPSALVSSNDSGVVQGNGSDWGPLTIVTETIDPKPGVPGVINVYQERIQHLFDYAYQDQTLGINYSAQISVPAVVPQTYVLSGQIENLVGSSLVNGGHGNVWFSMAMNPQFSEPYAPNSGNATLLFRFGTAPGTWNYSFEQSFDLGSGTISQNSYVGDYWGDQVVDLSGTAYFEATYLIDGTPGTVVNASSLSLYLWGDVSTYSKTYTGDIVERQLLSSVSIPALAVPETETYTMMLAGLGLVGFMARRRNLGV